jgi:hypothetical protein
VAARSDGARDAELHPALARFPPRWLVWVLLPGLIAPVLILGFIFVSELAHDEARCAYTKLATQTLTPDLRVREDVRSCLPGIEEHRYTAERAGSENVLGRRRFRASAFAADTYGWKASVSAQGEVRVDVHNAGHTDAVFREGTPAERGE